MNSTTDLTDLFAVEQGPLGARLVVTGEWRAPIADYMRKHQIQDLYLNYARGWKGKNLGFLSELPWLRGFTILDWGITDVSPIHCLTQLQLLQVDTYCKTPIDFGVFSALRDCRLTWRDGAVSVFACRSLRRLFLGNYTRSSSDEFGKLTGLEELRISSSAVATVTGLRPLRGLQFLGLYDLKQLAELDGIEALTSLTTLEIIRCRAVTRINPVAQLAKLRHLTITDGGKVESLMPISRLTELREVFFYGSTNIVDGDLSPLLELPYLQSVSYQNRRHYSHRRESIVASLKQ